MGTVAQNLQRLQNAKSAIASAITAKGGSVSSTDGFEAFPAAINGLPSGEDFVKYVEDSLSSVRLTCSFIPRKAFVSMSSLEYVSAPNCSYIGSATFRNCSSLISVFAPNCLSVYGDAFLRCDSLTTVKIPKCMYIGNSAFLAYTSGTSFLQVFLNEASTVCTLAGTSVFYRKSCSIYVPASLVDAYKSATNWTYIKNSIVAYQE